MKQKVTLSEEALRILVASSEGTPEPEVVAEVPEVVADEVVDPTIQLQADFDAFKAETEGKLSVAASSIEALTAELAGEKASVVALAEIVSSQIVRMRTALSLSAVDFSAMSADNIIKEFHATSATFMKSLPVGSVVPEDKDDVTEGKAITDSIVESSYKSLGFGSK